MEQKGSKIEGLRYILPILGCTILGMFTSRLRVCVNFNLTLLRVGLIEI